QLVSFERETVSVPTNISNGATASQAGENVEDVNNELSDAATGFGKQRGRTQISPTFGVFSTGQFGRTYHDGYRVRGGGTSGAVTPAFTGDSFSVIGTGELDASAQFNLEDIGLRISAFGGYAQNYVQLDRSVDGVNFTPFVGTGFNESGIFGGSVLVSKIAGEGNLNYGLVSAAGIFGSTNIRAADTGGRGSYGTQGVVISGKAGRNLAVSDNVRLDVRFGAAFNHFHGDGFTDDLGTRYGSSTVTAGQVSFEPGVSTAVLLGDVVVSPSARLLFIQRVGNDNSASVNGTSFTFEDADFTLGGQVATTFDVTDRLAAGIAVEGRVSEDDRTLLGKLSLTYLFGGG
ncbi:MAG: autotransporter domain-containing protein, partial [Pseudomonadota bacterium]